MDSVQKKVALDLFAHPFTVGATTVGVSALLLGWAVSSPFLCFAGIVGVLIGAGTLLTRWVFGLEKIAENAHRYLHEQKLQEQEQELDELDSKLSRDGDKRTHRLLRQLRDIYWQFSEDVKEGRISGTNDILEKVEDLFQACIKQLEFQLYIAEDIRDGRLTGKAKRQATKEREKAIEDVAAAVEDLTILVAKYHEFNVNRSENELSQLREELRRSLDVAAAVEDHRQSLFDGDKGYDIEKFRRHKE